MRDFVLDASTTGQDLLDRLSEEENACIKAAVGDFVYEVLRGTPLMAAAGGDGDSSAAAPLFACLTDENAVLLGFAMFDAAGGFEGDESLECLKELALDYPAIILARLGLEREGMEAVGSRDFVIGLYDCWNDEERVAFLVGMMDQLAEAGPYLGSDLVDLLPDSEVACVQEQLASEAYQAFLASNLTRGFGVQLHECFSDESHAQMFIAMTQARVTGGLADDTVACLLDFAREHPHFVEVSTTLDPASVTPADFAEIGRDGLRMLECMTEEELVRVQGAGASNLLAQ